MEVLKMGDLFESWSLHDMKTRSFEHVKPRQGFSFRYGRVRSKSTVTGFLEVYYNTADRVYPERGGDVWSVVPKKELVNRIHEIIFEGEIASFILTCSAPGKPWTLRIKSAFSSAKAIALVEPPEEMAKFIKPMEEQDGVG